MSNQILVLDLACMHAQSLKWCPTFCDLMDGNPPGFSVHGILQARILRVGFHALLQGIFWTQGSSPGIVSCISCTTGRFFTEPLGSPVLELTWRQLHCCRTSSPLCYLPEYLLSQLISRILKHVSHSTGLQFSSVQLLSRVRLFETL